MARCGELCDGNPVQRITNLDPEYLLSEADIWAALKKLEETVSSGLLD